MGRRKICNRKFLDDVADIDACWNAHDCTEVWGQLQVDCWAERSPEQCFEIDRTHTHKTTGLTRGACWADNKCWAGKDCTKEADEEAKSACQDSQSQDRSVCIS